MDLDEVLDKLSDALKESASNAIKAAGVGALAAGAGTLLWRAYEAFGKQKDDETKK